MKIKLTSALFFIFVLVRFNTQIPAQVIEQDSLALVAFFDSTDGVNWNNNDNWLNGKVSTWHGITVTGDRVTSISLNYNNLNGVLPHEFYNLTGLERLLMYGNNLRGEISYEIENLTNLISLTIASNNFSGNIPPEIGSLTNLELLVLAINEFTGNIPKEFGNLINLEILSLSKNQLDGNIPVELGSLTNLNSLFLGNNQFTGSIPNVLTSLTHLEELYLADNQLTGQLPIGFSNLIKLETLRLNNNQLEGEIPSEIGSIENLVYLNLFDNHFSGEIPHELGNLNFLEELMLGKNELTGPIPAEFGNFDSLTYLFLSYNLLNDTIPSELGNLSKLEFLSIGKNHLVGAVPEEITNLNKLKDLYLFANQLDQLPDLSSMDSLNRLNILNNKFTFEDIEPNLGAPKIRFDYSPQDSIGERIDTTIAAGSALTISVEVGGTANTYQWTKNGSEIDGAVSPSITIISADSNDEGRYNCIIENNLVAGLTLTCRPINVSVERLVNVEKSEVTIPIKFSLLQNFPNPFNPVTKIRYTIPSVNGNNVENQKVNLIIYDIIGRYITTLVSKNQMPGKYEIIWNAENYPSGIYIYQLSYKNMIDSKKLILLK